MKKCYLCENTEFIKRPGSVRDNTHLDVLECASCGLVFLSSFDHIKKGFYGDSHMHDKDKISIDGWCKLSMQNDDRRFQYCKQLLLNCKLLDFGCGTGGFLLKAQDIATTVHGVELELRLRKHYQKQNLTVFQNVKDIPHDICKEGYDVVTMFFVLEHLEDPKKVLFTLSELLTNNGQLIIEVPNADDALLTLYQCDAFTNFVYWSPHLYVYTVKTLNMLFSQLGLKINYIKQAQRYSLSNHLYWLTYGKPNGHKHWHFLDSIEIHTAYEKQLALIGKCDTLIASVSKG